MQKNMDAYIYNHATLMLEAVEQVLLHVHVCKILQVQLVDPANLNLIISNSLLFQTQNNLPWIYPSVRYLELFFVSPESWK